MRNRRSDASLVTAAAERPRLEAVEPARREHPILAVDGWPAAIAGIDAWARRCDWVVLDRGAQPYVCSRHARAPWQLLWFDPADAENVWALLAELRARRDTREILIVRRIGDVAALESPEVMALRELCREFRASLLLVIPPG